jgi:uncharacterized protein YbjQ (UPF0145 family)
MIIMTTDHIPGKKIKKNFGLVRGNTIRARHVGKDIMAGLKNLVGGEITQYTKLMAESRDSLYYIDDYGRRRRTPGIRHRCAVRR